MSAHDCAGLATLQERTGFLELIELGQLAEVLLPALHCTHRNREERSTDRDIAAALVTLLPGRASHAASEI
jgi:hypothetical protein